jgi:hypothetical protein
LAQVETYEQEQSATAMVQADAPANRVSRRDMTTPANAEVPFAIEEIFFSRTNEKGHILFGNSVFQRISHYPWSELCRKPHNIIRHPDMPRAVFWLLWDTIAKGEPVGAYVKNMAKDGRFYWVFAIVTPIEGGYLSVRIKPTGALLPIVEREYAALLAAEKAHRLKPAESAKILLSRLSELGFPDYGAFMATALSQEIKARDEKLGRALDKATVHFEGLAKESAALLKHATSAVADHTAHRYVPFNLRVHAAQLGEAGVTIGVIAMNYDVLATALEAMMSDFIACAQKLFSAVNKGLFLVGTAKIQHEASEDFKTESLAGELAPSGEIALLEEQRCSYEARAADGLRAIVTDAQHFEQACLELKQAVLALGTTRIMGKMESARLAKTDSGLADLLGDLERYQASMTESIQKMLTMSRCIEHDAGRLL